MPHLSVTYNPENNADLEHLRTQVHWKFWQLVYNARTDLPVDWWFYATVYALENDIDAEPPVIVRSFDRTILRGLSRVILEENDPWTQGMAPYGYGMVRFASWVDRHDGAGWGRDALASTVNERAGYGYEHVEHLADACRGIRSTGGPRSWRSC